MSLSPLTVELIAVVREVTVRVCRCAHLRIAGRKGRPARLALIAVVSFYAWLAAAAGGASRISAQKSVRARSQAICSH